MKLLAVVLSSLLLVLAETASTSCAPVTWSNEKRGEQAPLVGDAKPPKPKTRYKDPKKSLITTGKIAAGEINCRYETTTGDVVGPETCDALAKKYGIRREGGFFILNPTILPDCSNIEPNTVYCVVGFIEPLRAYDGLCGPPHNDATCIGTDAQCCNAETWTCGKTEKDCSPGICYEGVCAGHKVWSTDGTCGVIDGTVRQCTEKHGTCCSMEGQCGTGPEFCAHGNCQMGDCERPIQTEFKPGVGAWMGGNSTDGTCGGDGNMMCNAVYGYCCNKGNKCGSLSDDCGEGCQPDFGRCDNFATPTASADLPLTTITWKELPKCGQTCYQNMIIQFMSLGCKKPDGACLCKNGNFLREMGRCAQAICYDQSQVDLTIAYGNAYCLNKTAEAEEAKTDSTKKTEL